MVENLNDNQPMFVQDGVMVEEVNVNVTEEQPAGTIVFVLEVRVGGCEDGSEVEGPRLYTCEDKANTQPLS